MSKKRLNIVLGLALAGVWGIIAYKLFWPSSAEEQSTVTPITMVQHAEQEALGTDSLSLDYRDPFLGKTKRRRVKRRSTSSSLTANTGRASNGSTASAPRRTTNTPNAEPTSTTWPELQYQGLIQNSTSQKSIGILSVGGTSHMCSSGDVIENITVQALTPDSVLVGMGKEVRWCLVR